jgi:hypothetical protein
MHELPNGGDIVEALQAKPQGLRVRFTVAFSTEEAT